MASPDLSARPLGIAEIIDRAIALTRRHFAALFVAMLAVQVPAVLLARQLPDALRTLGTVADPARGLDDLRRVLQLLGVVYAIVVALQAVATAAAATIVRPSLDPRAAARPAPVRQAWAVLTTALAQVVVASAAPIVAALPGVVLALQPMSPATILVGVAGAVLGSVLAFVVVTLRFLIAPAAAALEGRAGPSALLRSWRLMGPRPGMRFAERPGVRASLVLLAMLVLALAVNAVAGIPRALAQHLLGEGGLAGLGATLPLALDLPITIFEAVAAAAVQPFSLVAIVLFYFDRRARTEGLDLELWADRLEGAAR